ncbi:MAG: DUF192 domain-containing protein [Armatimonadetes bacterium]|nr:DUF192 domain-containing protein [Armatimonadota bacterium]
MSLSKTPNGINNAARLYAGTECVAEQVIWAQSWWEQLRGVIGRHLAPTNALLIPGCSQVHTAFVAYPITVAFCRAEGEGGATWRVLSVQTLPPWNVSRHVRGATLAIEMPLGSPLRGVSVGDLLTETLRI